MSEVKSKIYLEVVDELRRMIESDGLNPGDKIPSERELSDRLSVGRSSVREALRALELLGLIETRRGEGTFIKDFQEHKLVELLGTFFLQNEKVKKDLAETKQLVELDCLKIMIATAEDGQLEEFQQWAVRTEFDDPGYFAKIASVNRNKLLERIWSIVNTYSKAADVNLVHTDRQSYLELAGLIAARREDEAVSLYRNKIRNMSNSE